MPPVFQSHIERCTSNSRQKYRTDCVRLISAIFFISSSIPPHSDGFYLSMGRLTCFFQCKQTYLIQLHDDYRIINPWKQCTNNYSTKKNNRMSIGEMQETNDYQIIHLIFRNPILRGAQTIYFSFLNHLRLKQLSKDEVFKKLRKNIGLA